MWIGSSFALEDCARRAVSWSTTPHSIVGRGGRCKVSMNHEVGNPSTELPDPSPGDCLAIIQLYPLQVSAANQVVQTVVSDQRTVIQLQQAQVLLGTGGAAQVADTLVCDQLTVGEGERM